MFNNKKITYIRGLPEGNNILLIWIMLLTMAGNCNHQGYIFLTEKIPYTPELLAKELGFEINTIRLALDALEKLNMISRDDHLYITNWCEYQNVEGMDKVRIQTQKRVAKHRAKKKALALSEKSSCNVTSNATVTESNATEREEERDKEKEEDKEHVTSVDVTKQLVLVFEKCIGRMIKPMQLETLLSYLEDVEFPLIEHILKYSCSKDDPYQYAKKVLENCVDNGIHTVNEFELKLNERKEKHLSTSSMSKVDKFNQMDSRDDIDFDEIERLEKKRLDKILEEQNGRG